MLIESQVHICVINIRRLGQYRCGEIVEAKLLDDYPSRSKHDWVTRKYQVGTGTDYCLLHVVTDDAL